MLYVMLSDGSIDEVPEAVGAFLDRDGNLVCVDDDDVAVATYARLDVMAFSGRPFPGQDGPADQAPDDAS